MDRFFKEEHFSRTLVLSFLLHLLLLGIALVKITFFPSEPLIFQDVMRVDLVALPDKRVVKEPPKVAKKKVKIAKPNPKKTTPKAAKKKKPVVQKNKQRDALRQLEALSALDALKNLETETVEKAEKTPPEPPKKKEFKGNVISVGSSLTGVQKLQQNRYLGQVKQHIAKFWFLPEWLAKSDYKTQITIKIDDDGNLLQREVTKSSGNNDFDQLVIDTVEKSNPLPKPPEKFVEIVAAGVLLGFPE